MGLEANKIEMGVASSTPSFNNQIMESVLLSL
jgi:hypothetical protein